MHDDSSVTSARSTAQFQFTLTSLLLFTLAVASALTLLVVVPVVIAVPVIIFLSMAVPAVLTVGLVYGESSVRTFCIGALFPTGVLLYATGWILGLSTLEPPSTSDLESFSQWVEFFEEIAAPYRVYAGSSWVSSIVIGLICVGARRWISHAVRR